MKEKGVETKVPEGRPLCEICGEPAIANDSGVRHCQKHHEDWTKCITEEKMRAAHHAANRV